MPPTRRVIQWIIGGEKFEGGGQTPRYKRVGMIRKVVLRRFKRFEEETFPLPGHIVFAGPNNTGKTTVLQAIAAWGPALNRWKALNDFAKHNGAYAKAPIARHAFSIGSGIGGSIKERLRSKSTAATGRK